MKLFFSAFCAVSLSASVAGASCTLYQHRDFGGSHWVLNSGDRMVMTAGESVGVTTNGHCPSCEGSTLHEPSWNDQVSSFRTGGSCTLTLWEHVNEGGAHFRSSRSYSYVGDGWNDEASEALCTCQ